jgi:hypothetical protein
MSTLTIYNKDDFLKADFHKWDEIIITESVEIPLIEDDGITVDPMFETYTTYPFGVRKKFLHPSLYGIKSFSVEYRGLVNDLAKRIKREQKVVFLYSDSNLFLLCYIMAEIFQDCQGHHRDYLEYTNIPFPYKRSDITNAWIWACNWSQDFPLRIETEEEAENFRNYVRLDFPRFNSEHFPVRPLIDNTENGVISFSVHLGKGVLEVIPGHPIDEIKVTIKDFPGGKLDKGRLRGRNEMRIELFIEHGQMSWSDNLTFVQILRFLLIYYASKRYLGLAFDRTDNVKTDMFYVTDSGLEIMPYKELFLTKNGEYDINISSTLAKLVYPFTKNGLPEKAILKVSDKNTRLPCPYNQTLQVECYHNITVAFSSQALKNLAGLEFVEARSALSDNDYKDIRFMNIDFDEFKKTVLSIFSM